MVTGGSRMTGSGSVCEKLLVRARGTSGAGGAGAHGGTITSGSKKYIHLDRGSDGGQKRWWGRHTNERDGPLSVPSSPGEG